MPLSRCVFFVFFAYSSRPSSLFFILFYTRRESEKKKDTSPISCETGKDGKLTHIKTKGWIWIMYGLKLIVTNSQQQLLGFFFLPIKFGKEKTASKYKLFNFTSLSVNRTIFSPFTVN